MVNRAQYKVSVVIPTYNRCDDLIDSIMSLNFQTYPTEWFEVIVVDGGSTDSTSEALEEMSRKLDINLRYLYQQNRGPGAARNLGIKAARGDIICFIDSDCVADPMWIEAHVKSYTEKNIGGIGGDILPYRSSSLIARYADRYEYQPRITENNKLKYIDTANASFKKEVLEEVNGFDENILYTEDTDLSIRIKKAGYDLKFSKNAKVYHKHKTSLLELMNRAFTYARYGSYLLYMKYPDDLSFYKAFAYTNFRIVFNILSYPVVIVKSMFSDDVALSMAKPFIQNLILSCRIMGWLAGIIHHKMPLSGYTK